MVSTFAEWGDMFRQPVQIMVSRIRAWTRTSEGLHRRTITASPGDE